MDFNNFLNNYFGPLPKEYCVYFYALSILFGAIFVISAISFVTFIVLYYKKVNMMFIVNSSLVLLQSFLVYLVNRLLHTMCVKSV